MDVIHTRPNKLKVKQFFTKLQKNKHHKQTWRKYDMQKKHTKIEVSYTAFPFKELAEEVTSLRKPQLLRRRVPGGLPAVQETP